MERIGHRPHLANPHESKKRMGKPNKHDTLDAGGLAILLHNGTQNPADGFTHPPDCGSGFRRSAGAESPINLRLDRLRRDLEFGKLRRGPAGVGGKDQPHVPRGGPRREGEADGVARGRIKRIPCRGNDGRVSGAVGRNLNRQRLGPGRPS